MLKSDSIKEISAALAKAQSEMFNPKFDSENPHFRSKFASLASVRNAVIPSFSKHGLAILQHITSTESSVKCGIVITHSSGEWMEFEPLDVPVSKADAQGFMSAATYAKRGTLQAITCVVGDDDDDGNAASAAKPNHITKPTNDISFKPDADQQTFMLSIVDSIIANKEDIQKCVDLFYQSNLDNEEKVWIWDKLQPHSALRSAMKKLHDANKTK